MTLANPRPLAGGFLPTLTVAVLFLALVFGGGSQQGFWSDALIQLASLPLLAVAVLTIIRAFPARSNVRAPLVLVGALLLLPLLQLVALPPFLWAGLAGRADIAQAYAAADIPLPWLPLSLNPTATWRSFVTLLPAVALFLATLLLEERWHRVLILWVLAVVFISIPLDLLQMMGGPDSQLRFFTITNPDRAVGFFANANHNAAFLYSAVPFAVALGIGQFRHKHRTRGVVLLVALLLFAIVIGIAATRSRAGAALGFVAWVSSMALVWRFGTGASRRLLTAFAFATSLLALLLAFQFGFVSLSDRLQDPDSVGAFRWNILAVTLHGVANYFPFGSGLGTFVEVYQHFEPRTILLDKYINHAHNDWLELCLEGGLLALAVLIGFVFWLSRSIFTAWRDRQSRGGEDGVVFAQAGSVVIVLLMLHSGVEYPLRTASLMAVFAISCGLLVSSLRARKSAEAAVEPTPTT